MAGASSEQGENKLNVELNLVPFIDLLSSLVLFLLVTAVWLQVGTIPASVESSGKALFSQAEQDRLTVHLNSTGFDLTWPKIASFNSLVSKVPKVAGVYSFQKLEAVLNIFPKTAKMPLSAVSSDDGVEYGMVIETIDSLKRSGFSIVALSVD